MSLDLWLWVPVDTGNAKLDRVEVFSGLNYTHNVTPMWKEAGVYEALYMSDGKPAGDFIAVIRKGIADMEDHPSKYEVLNPANGWGKYESALDFLREWLAACVEYPRARIGVSK